MTSTPTWTIFCDLDDGGPECHHWHDTDVLGASDSAPAARAAARADGWRRKRIDGRLLDVCPFHARTGGSR